MILVDPLVLEMRVARTEHERFSGQNDLVQILIGTNKTLAK